MLRGMSVCGWQAGPPHTSELQDADLYRQNDLGMSGSRNGWEGFMACHEHGAGKDAKMRFELGQRVNHHAALRGPRMRLSFPWQACG